MKKVWSVLIICFLSTNLNSQFIQQGSKPAKTGVQISAAQSYSSFISSVRNTVPAGGGYYNNSNGAAWNVVRTSATYTICSKAGAGGTISPSGDVHVNEGCNQTFKITPNAGYYTSAVMVDGECSCDSVKSYTFKNVRADHCIEVSFTYGTTSDIPIPILAYPTGGILVYTNSPILNWYINKYFPGAKYHLQLSESSDFKKIVFEKDNIDALWLEVSGLKGGTTYYSRVRLKTPSGAYGQYSAVGSFKIKCLCGFASVRPILAYPTGGITVYTSSPILNWYINQWAPPLKYQLQLSLTEDFKNIILDITNIDGLSYQVYGLSSGVTYYSRVRSFTSDWNYSDYSLTGSFTVYKYNGTQAVTPILAYPTGGITVYTISPILNWYIGAYAPMQKYHLQVSKKPDFSSFVVNQDDISGIQYQLTNLSYGMTYYTRVRGKAPDGSYSLFSTPGSFTVYSGNFPVIPIAANPSGGVDISSSSALLSWYFPTSTSLEQKYDLQISTNQDFSDLTQITGIDSLSYMINDLKEETEYFWRVRSKTQDGKVSEYSNEGSFFTSKLSMVALRRDNQIPEKYDLSQNYPNPFNPSTTIEFSVAKDEWVSIQVFDMLGRVAKTLIKENLNAGNYKVNFSAQDLSSGVYIYKLSTPSVNIIKKMIFQK